MLSLYRHYEVDRMVSIRIAHIFGIWRVQSYTYKLFRTMHNLYIII